MTQVFETHIVLEFTQRSLAAIRAADEAQKGKPGHFRGYNFAQIIKIGEALLHVYKQKNYFGQEVDEYFATEEWAVFMSDYVKPSVATFDKNLCSVSPRAVLEKKATLGEIVDSSCDMLDSMLLEQSPPVSPKKSFEEDVNEHAVIIDPQYLDSNLFQIPVSHDIEDLLREVNE